MFKALSSALYFRHIAGDLTRIANALERQTTLLARVADRLAPQLPADSPAERATIRADTGLSHLDADDAALALDYIARTERATGHTPDEEEILIYLADEKTTSLQERLAARDADLARLAESRR